MIDIAKLEQFALPTDAPVARVTGRMMQIIVQELRAAEAARAELAQMKRAA